MIIHILFQNDSPQMAFADEARAERVRKALAKESDGSIEQGIFHIKSVELIEGPLP
jgi:hypothetical protein